MSGMMLKDRVAILERRLARLEAYLGFPPLPDSPVDEAGEAPVSEPATSVAVTPPPIPGPVFADGSPSPFPQPAAQPGQESEPQPARVPPVPPRAVLAYQSPAAPKPLPQTGLEQAIGLKWAGWVGAIVLVIGAGLGIKFAYENGWFNVISPPVRLGLMFLTGLTLIAAGEWVYRKVNTLSAAGLFGAGVAVLFLVSFAGHRYYGLYARETAYVLMGISTVIGAAVAVRGDLVSVAVLSTLGGNLAPLVLGGDTRELFPFLSYLLMLQGVALFLAWWGRNAKWWTLRALSLATLTLWISTLIGSRPPAELGGIAVVFILVYAGMFHFELIASGFAAGAGAGTGDATASPVLAEGSRPADRELAKPGVLFSALVTAGATAATLAVLHHWSDHSRGLLVLAFGSGCAMLGLMLRASNANSRGLSVGYRVQAAILLVAAVPVAFSGIAIEMGWALLATGFAVMAAVLDLRISRVAAVATWGLAVGHLADRAGLQGAAVREAWITIFRQGVPQYAVIAWGLALIGHALGWCIGRGLSPRSVDARNVKDFRSLGTVVSVAATALWVGVSVAALPPVGATLSCVLFAWLLVAADFATDRLGWAVQAVVVLALATVKWSIVDTLMVRLSPNWSAVKYAPVFNPVMGMGVLIAASLAALGWLRRRSLMKAMNRWAGGKASERDAVLGIAALVILLMTVGLSFEIDRAVERVAASGATAVWPLGQLKQLSWTVLWTAATCGFFGLVFGVEPLARRRVFWVQQFWALPLMLTVKFLSVDTLWFRLARGVAATPVLFNFQMLTAVVLVGGLVMVRFLVDSSDDDAPAGPGRSYGRFAASLIVLTLLWCGSLEIDRYFETAARTRMPASDADRAKQVALSIYWAIFAVGAVLAGFRIRAALVRYFGLGLFGLTLLKIFFIDLGDVRGGYRVLSFMGLGLLLLGTSVVYGKLSPKLLGTGAGDETGRVP